MRLLRSIVILVFIIRVSGAAFAEYPETQDTALLAGGAALLISTELFKEQIAPAQPRWVNPPDLDASARTRVKWKDENLSTAARASDVVLYGFAIPSFLWVPALTNSRYTGRMHAMAEVLVVNGLITQAFKLSVARQRPYAHFGTIPTRGRDDNLSFFSGHTSFAFAMATASAYLLGEEFPRNNGLIWGSAMLVASAAAYFRIAADKHYFTDVMGGALVGVTVGYLLMRSRRSDIGFTADAGGVKTSFVVLTW